MTDGKRPENQPKQGNPNDLQHGKPDAPTLTPPNPVNKSGHTKQPSPSPQATAKRPAGTPTAATPKKQIAAQKPKRSLHSNRSIIPRETISGTALIFVIGIMAFLASLTLGAVSLVKTSASQWQSDISREITIQIRPSDKVEMQEALREASRIALTFDGISQVDVLGDEETVRLLEPWLGSGLQLDELPVPRILTVSLIEGAKPDFDALRKKLKEDVPGSSLDDHQAWVERLTTMAWTMVAIGSAIFLLVMAATVTTVIFATRGAMAGNKDVIEVLHFVGADGSFISNQFQYHFLLMGLKGAAAGTIGAIALFVMLGLWSSQSFATPEGAQISALFGTFSLGFWGYFGMFSIMILVAFLSALTSRWTVQNQVNTLQNYRKDA